MVYQSLKRLPFRLPEWAPRVTWASAEKRATWESRIASVSNAFVATERELVVRGLRPAALQNVAPDRLPSLIRELAPHGVVVLPLGQTPRADSYRSAARPAQPGEALDYRCAITRPEYAAAWAEAWERSDNERIGELLGYPSCCRDFFDRVWTRERWMDTTVPMARGSSAPSGPINMLWRWFGVRPVSHLPCGFDCAASMAMSREVREAMPPDEGVWMDKILSWPVRYTSWRGIAELTTPIFRASVPTDALAERFELFYRGSGLVAVAITPTSDPAANGFNSKAAMDAAHARVLAPIRGRTFGTVVDLGCGDGTLLLKIPAKRRVGVEIDPQRAEKARKRLDRVEIGDCVADKHLLNRILYGERPDLVIAQKDRNPPETLSAFHVLSYSYETGAVHSTLFT